MCSVNSKNKKPIFPSCYAFVQIAHSLIRINSVLRDLLWNDDSCSSIQVFLLSFQVTLRLITAFTIMLRRGETLSLPIYLFIYSLFYDAFSITKTIQRRIIG
jgi:hypothetical protein